MGFHIIIGGPTRRGPFRTLYCGSSGAEGESAMAAAGDAVFGILNNPSIRFKNNSHAAASPIAAPPPAEESTEASQAEESSAPRGRGRGRS